MPFMSSEAAQQAAQTVYGFAQNAIQNRYQRKQAAQQNQYAIDMWNRNNEYNSPINQMNRFNAAGLNPNLIYGQGNAGNSGSPPVMEAPQRKAPSLDLLGKTAQVIAVQNAKTQGQYLKGQIELQQTQQQAMEQSIEESKSKVALNAANRGLMFSKGELMHLQQRSKYGSGDLGANAEELYQIQKSAMRLRNDVMLRQLNNLHMDYILKGDVHHEKAYYNMLRDTLGLEKGDNVFIRGGVSLWNKAKDYIMKTPSFRNWRGK